MSNEDSKSIVENNGKAEWIPETDDEDLDERTKESLPLQPRQSQKQSGGGGGVTNKEVKCKICVYWKHFWYFFKLTL